MRVGELLLAGVYLSPKMDQVSTRQSPGRKNYKDWTCTKTTWRPWGWGEDSRLRGQSTLAWTGRWNCTRRFLWRAVGHMWKNPEGFLGNQKWAGKTWLLRSVGNPGRKESENGCPKSTSPSLSLSFFFFFFAPLLGLWDLSSLTRDWTCAPCPGSEES